MAEHATLWRAIAIALTALTAVVTAVDARQDDASVILQFQRAADSYAFAQRHDERSGSPPARLVEGTFFTRVAAAAFRSRIHTAISPACGNAESGEGGFEVPSVNLSASATMPLPRCVASALPSLPAELEYRVAGIALILADTRRGIVVDILHAAFP